MQPASGHILAPSATSASSLLLNALLARDAQADANRARTNSEPVRRACDVTASQTDAPETGPNSPVSLFLEIVSSSAVETGWEM